MACIVRLWRMLSPRGTDTLVFDECPPSCGRTLRMSLLARRYWSWAVMLTLVPV